MLAKMCRKASRDRLKLLKIEQWELKQGNLVQLRAIEAHLREDN